MNPEVKAFFDAGTWTLTYVAWDPDTRDAVVIDECHHANIDAPENLRIF